MVKQLDLARRAYDQDIKDRLRGRIVELLSDLSGEAPPTKRTSRETFWRGYGSLKAHHAGPRRGQWIDREAGGKSNKAAGGPLDAIRFFAGVEAYRDQIVWAADWLGVPQFDPRDAAKIDRKKVAERLAERKRIADENARRLAEDEARNAAEKRRRASDTWAACVDIAGTPGEVYLKRTRKIPFNAAPSSVRWSPDHAAVAYAITDKAGDLRSIHFEAVTPEGEKDDERVWIARDPNDKRAKHTIAPIGDGAALRLPGPADGPIFIGEGPVTAMSAWAAGVEAMATVGPINLDRIPQLVEKGRKVLVGFEDDPITGKHSGNRKIAFERKRKIRKLRRDGYDVLVVSPFDVRRRDKSDFNDLLKEQGIAAVSARLQKFASDGEELIRDDVDLDQARRELERVIDRDMRELIAWVRNDDSEFAPAISYKVTAGVGKTKAVLKALLPILRWMRANGDDRAIVIAVPFHDLGDDVRERYDDIKAAEDKELDVVEEEARAVCAGEFIARSYRGREARKPRSDELMCGNVDVVRQANKLRVRDITKEICKAECPLKDRCDYLDQKHLRADIWLVSHQSLFSEVPAPISKSGVALAVVDETPWMSGVLPDAEILVRTIPDMRLGEGDRYDVERFHDLRRFLLEAVIQNGEGPLKASILRAKGFEESGADFARDMERARTIEDGPWREREPNLTVGPMMRAWVAIRELLASRKEESGWLRVEKDTAGNLILRVRGVMSVSKGWRVPSLHIDASLDPTILRFFWPRLEERAPIAVDAPHATILQATDRSFAKSQLEPLLGELKTPEAEKIEKSRDAERRRVKAFIAARHRENGGDAFAIGNKRAIEAMELEDLPGVEIGHFNAICGKDNWGGVRSGFVIGRTQPGAQEVERIAEALTGDVIEPIGSEYARGDGERLVRRGGEIVKVPCEVDLHPHPIAERVRRRIADEEVYQAIQRARLVKRTAADPVTVYVLTNVALPIPIDGEIDPDEIRYPTPRDRMLAEGGIAFESAAAASKAYPHLWPTPGRLREQLSHRRKVEVEKGVAEAITVRSSYKKLILGQSDSVRAIESLSRVEFQRAAPKLHREVAYIDPRRVADPRAAIEALVGPLAWFRGAEPEAPEIDAEILPIAVGAEDFRRDTRAGAREADEDLQSSDAPASPLVETALVAANLMAQLAPKVRPPPEPDNDDEGPGPEPPIVIDWAAVRQRAADCNLPLGDVARRCGRSPSHFRNIQTGFRKATAEDAAAVARFLSDSAPTQGNLF